MATFKKFSVAKRYNREKLFTIDTADFEYYSLEDLYDMATEAADDAKATTGKDLDVEDIPFTVYGIYINTKGNFDPAPVLALEDRYVNLPAHMTPVCEDMLRDAEAVKAINEGHVGITVYQYQQKRFNKTCYNVRWVDL